ncbi:FKBP-type peptidyl-prolyl cis-trans isomerase [Novosphingobium colocasiae]|uniref:Peptidyl-prolyl cis-trans isomerase n=1 Tax=Novosphingobium colocasiae TaxID=1256513 RepID=A0A918PFY3_9SPHN|nr:FKBP-type peptidyl-prolyl cis-trans isomerase [Novosphingobium colocasiae]GGZ06476.1 hypothetical protein GCM10011614_21780 [Novosphingobium colocasiae]
MRVRGFAAVLLAGMVPAVAVAQPAPATAPQPAVTVETLAPGSGGTVPEHSWVLIDYKGMLTNGTVFDQQQHMPMALDGVVPGFARGLVQMQRGGRYKLTIPPELGYGAQQTGPIPPNSTLVFEISLIDFKTPAEIAVIEAEAQQRAAVQAQALIDMAKSDKIAPPAP